MAFGDKMLNLVCTLHAQIYIYYCWWSLCSPVITCCANITPQPSSEF